MLTKTLDLTVILLPTRFGARITLTSVYKRVAEMKSNETGNMNENVEDILRSSIIELAAQNKEAYDSLLSKNRGKKGVIK